MTKKLEELFDLDDSKAASSKPPKAIHQEIASVDDSEKAIKKIAKTLPAISELKNLGDKELDKLANKAELAHDELMDLGMNVEIRYSGRIFEVAGTMLKSAIDAKAAKIDKKLKAVDLQLKKLKIDNDNKPKGSSDDVIDGEGFIITDRNELLKNLGNNSDKKD
jgi:hypothetical protein